jgi:16S rRNA (uracil1498-N3)-methyltransferase
VTPPVFYLPADAMAGDRIVLDGPEGRHAATVRRLRAGERVDVADGMGTVAECVVVQAERDRLLLDVVTRRVEPESELRLVVVQALAKGGRDEDAVEMLTEVGVDEVVPWAAERSVVRWAGERGDKALARWQSAAREAAKQARRARVPVIAPLAATTDVAARLAGAALPVVLHEAATSSLAELVVPSAGEVVVVVGPEGGISDAELQILSAPACRLGSSVLRTSTAGVAAAAVLMARSGRWQGNGGSG